MRSDDLLELLRSVAAGRTGAESALERLRDLPFEAVGDFALLDTHRDLRCGFVEVLLAEGKTPEQCAAIARRMAEGEGPFLATRVDPERAEVILAAVPGAEYHSESAVCRPHIGPTGGRWPW
jgi:NCAIR mutase (PurE)-related protein